jgi:TatD DNase family protein
MIDSHCHLNLQHFEDDREATIARAVSDGVVAFVNIGYDKDSLRETLELVERYPFIFGAAGVHPHDAATLTTLEAQVRHALDHPRILARSGRDQPDFYRNLRRAVQPTFRRMIKPRASGSAIMLLPRRLQRSPRRPRSRRRHVPRHLPRWPAGRGMKVAGWASGIGGVVSVAVRV